MQTFAAQCALSTCLLFPPLCHVALCFLADLSRQLGHTTAVMFCHSALSNNRQQHRLTHRLLQGSLQTFPVFLCCLHCANPPALPIRPCLCCLVSPRTPLSRGWSVVTCRLGPVPRGQMRSADVTALTAALRRYSDCVPLPRPYCGADWNFRIALRGLFRADWLVGLETRRGERITL